MRDAVVQVAPPNSVIVARFAESERKSTQKRTIAVQISPLRVLHAFPAVRQPQERAMWMQAIREAISLGQEFLSQGEEVCLTMCYRRLVAAADEGGCGI